MAWFDDIAPGNKYTAERDRLAEQLRGLDYQPELEAEQAELARLMEALELTPSWSNPILTALLDNSIKELQYSIAKTQEDVQDRKAQAIEGCADLDAQNWAITTGALGFGEAGSDLTQGSWQVQRTPPTNPDYMPVRYKTFAGEDTDFAIPGRVSKVSKWNFPQYKFEASEGVAAPKLSDYVPGGWLNKFLTQSGIRPIGAQEDLSGAKLAQLQELHGWSKGGMPQTLDKYMDVMGQFGTHWADIYKQSTDLIPRWQGARGRTRAAVQR